MVSLVRLGLLGSIVTGILVESFLPPLAHRVPLHGVAHPRAIRSRATLRPQARSRSRLAPSCLHLLKSPLEGIPSSFLVFRRSCDVGFRGEGSAGVEVELQLGLAEESDLADVAVLLEEVFPQDLILMQGDFSELETKILSAPIEMTNSYVRAVAYYEVLYSIKSRCGKRLSEGTLARSNDSVLLVLRDPSKGGRIVGVAELSLRKPDGKIPSNWPFPNPWRSEEPLAQVQPYMCNLAISEGNRGQGFGKQLVRLCECIARNRWGYGRMYLHVNLGDPVALGLYQSLGYKSIEEYDMPLWFRRLMGLPLIRYQCKCFMPQGLKDGEEEHGESGEGRAAGKLPVRAGEGGDVGVTTSSPPTTVD
ncbi:unnamed protein product [Discosporangium mesarthrocarpum]